VVEPNNPKAFAEGLIYLADHPEKRKEFGKNARALAEKEFAREKLANKFVDFLESV
jgi:glycosyltransferase involved in cell wall biosynthesis